MSSAEDPHSGKGGGEVIDAAAVGAAAGVVEDVDDEPREVIAVPYYLLLRFDAVGGAAAPLVRLYWDPRVACADYTSVLSGLRVIYQPNPQDDLSSPRECSVYSDPNGELYIKRTLRSLAPRMKRTSKEETNAQIHLLDYVLRAASLNDVKTFFIVLRHYRDGRRKFSNVPRVFWTEEEAKGFAMTFRRSRATFYAQFTCTYDREDKVTEVKMVEGSSVFVKNGVAGFSRVNYFYQDYVRDFILTTAHDFARAYWGVFIELKERQSGEREEEGEGGEDEEERKGIREKCDDVNLVICERLVNAIRTGQGEVIVDLVNQVRQFLDDNVCQMISDQSGDVPIFDASFSGSRTQVVHLPKSPWESFMPRLCVLRLLATVNDPICPLSTLDRFDLQFEVLDCISRLLEILVIRSRFAPSFLLPELLSQQLKAAVQSHMNAAPERSSKAVDIVHLLKSVKQGLGEIKTDAPPPGLKVAGFLHCGAAIFQIATGAATMDASNILKGAVNLVQSGIKLYRDNKDFVLSLIERDSWFSAIVELRRLYYVIIALTKKTLELRDEDADLDPLRVSLRGALDLFVENVKRYVDLVGTKRMCPEFAYAIMKIVNDLIRHGYCPRALSNTLIHRLTSSSWGQICQGKRNFLQRLDFEGVFEAAGELHDKVSGFVGEFVNDDDPAPADEDQIESA